MGKVCVIFGAGRGVGQGVANIFANEEDFEKVVCIRRTKPQDYVEVNADDYYVSDSSKASKVVWKYFDVCCPEEELKRYVDEIEEECGQIDVAIYNVGCNAGLRLLDRTRASTMTKVLNLGVIGALNMARVIVPLFKKRGGGFLGFTGATASIRAVQEHHAHAAAMAARRSLAHSLAHELNPHNIHVSHVIIDGPVDAPDTLGKVFPEFYQSEQFQKMIVPLMMILSQI